ncbi:MAG: FAD:protein FMN transferase [Anaerolineae bacterium]|nr:FAD:protein FMN transferase [Anaerolineae bacterium]
MIYKVAFKAMGCQMSALLETTENHKNILEKVPAWFEKWENIFSRFRPESELNRLNDHAGLVMPVSMDLWQVLRLSLKIERLSNGLVTPIILDALEQAGYKYSFESGIFNYPYTFNQSLTISALNEMVMLPERRAVILPPGMRLDMGGIVKGWAAHQSMRRLQKYGATLVDAGGDISVSAPYQTSLSWPVAVRHPLNENVSLGVLQIQQGGVATSGKDFRRWKRDGIWHHHIIDPRTALPAKTDLLTVTAFAPTVIQAEMIAKTIFILGSRNGLTWLDKFPQAAALLVFEDGSSQATSNLLPVWEEYEYQ